MPDYGVTAADIVGRINSLRRPRPDGTTETIAEACKRWGVNSTAISKWRSGDRVSLGSILQIIEAEKHLHPDLSIDWIVYGDQPGDHPYEILDRLASDIREAINRAYALTPERKVLELRKREPPDEAP